MHLCSMLVFYPLHQSHSGRQSRDISKCNCELADYRLARSKYINKTVMNRMEQCNITVYLSKLFKVFIKRLLIKCMLFFFFWGGVVRASHPADPGSIPSLPEVFLIKIISQFFDVAEINQRHCLEKWTVA